MASEPAPRPAPQRPQRPRLPAEDGNTLLLMPVGVLVLLVLGAIAVDAAVAFMGDRELANLTAGAANDAAAAIDEDVLYLEDRVVLDPARVQAVVDAVVAARPDDTVEMACVPQILPPDEVRVTCEGNVPLIFSPAVPGGADAATIQATSVARLADQ